MKINEAIREAKKEGTGIKLTIHDGNLFAMEFRFLLDEIKRLQQNGTMAEETGMYYFSDDWEILKSREAFEELEGRIKELSDRVTKTKKRISGLEKGIKHLIIAICIQAIAIICVAIRAIP